ncbi:hypothetical protein BH23PAT2_BH23PAT2_08740 [soil metagenome]
MPARNIVKYYAVDSFYHIYNRGVEKRKIFLDDNDYRYFLYLLKRHLGKEIAQDKAGRLLPNYRQEVELLAFCLITNHFHLLIWQKDLDGMTKFMRSICTSYTVYFNKKYKRVGKLLQGAFKAKRITTDEYYQHISRYIHLNPPSEPLEYEWSSIAYYSGELQADWIKPQKILDIFGSWQTYKLFLEDYADHKEILDEIKYELADH